MIPIKILQRLAIKANDNCLTPCKTIDLRFVESIVEQVKSELISEFYKDGNVNFSIAKITQIINNTYEDT